MCDIEAHIYLPMLRNSLCTKHRYTYAPEFFEHTGASESNMVSTKGVLPDRHNVRPLKEHEEGGFSRRARVIA